MVDGLLADAGIRAALAKHYKDSGISVPLEQLPREKHAQSLAKLGTHLAKTAGMSFQAA